jgi:molybdopterin synthase catalytic subunit
MKVRLLFFAVLRDVAGCAEAALELPGDATPRSVWNGLRARHADLEGYVDPPLTAVNERYADPDQPLRDGDELAFIPPVAGG